MDRFIENPNTCGAIFSDAALIFPEGHPMQIVFNVPMGSALGGWTGSGGTYSPRSALLYLCSIISASDGSSVHSSPKERPLPIGSNHDCACAPEFICRMLCNTSVRLM